RAPPPAPATPLPPGPASGAPPPAPDAPDPPPPSTAAPPLPAPAPDAPAFPAAPRGWYSPLPSGAAHASQGATVNATARSTAGATRRRRREPSGMWGRVYASRPEPARTPPDDSADDA